MSDRWIKRLLTALTVIVLLAPAAPVLAQEEEVEPDETEVTQPEDEEAIEEALSRQPFAGFASPVCRGAAMWCGGEA